MVVRALVIRVVGCQQCTQVQTLAMATNICVELHFWQLCSAACSHVIPVTTWHLPLSGAWEGKGGEAEAMGNTRFVPVPGGNS